MLTVTSDHRPAVVGQTLDAGALGLVPEEDLEESLVEAVWDAARGSLAVSSRLAQQLVTFPSWGRHSQPGGCGCAAARSAPAEDDDVADRETGGTP